MSAGNLFFSSSPPGFDMTKAIMAAGAHTCWRNPDPVIAHRLLRSLLACGMVMSEIRWTGDQWNAMIGLRELP
jgi:hypothetical protein